MPVEGVYQHPKYYELAFSWRDIGAEVDVFEEVIRRYSAISVKRMLEVACGSAPHLPELHRRGYEYVGLDLSRDMLTYASARVQNLGASATFIEGDLVDFHLVKKVDFAYILLGSLYIRSTADLLAHFGSMSRALRPGGLYLLDWCINFSTNENHNETWTIEREGITVTTTYSDKLVNAVEQTHEETITMVVKDCGKSTTIREVAIRRQICPQEFLSFLTQQNEFEFMGWWNNWDITQSLEYAKSIQRPITVIRRR